MFHHRFDATRALAVLVFAPPAIDTDIDEYVACITRLDGVCAERDGALILVLESGYPLPDAKARKRGVDARKGMRSRPVVAVVTTNPLLRAGLAAARWISPPPFEQHVVATFEEALPAIESKRGGTTLLLRRMYEEAIAHLALQKNTSTPPRS